MDHGFVLWIKKGSLQEGWSLRKGGKMEVSKGHQVEELAGFATEVMRLTGQKALSHYGRGRAGLKFDEALVTEAELQLTELFREQLQARFPGHQINGPVQNDKGYSHEGRRYLWIYDPLDGVANFQAGIPIWGTSLALVENFWPIFGLFYMPSTGDLFFAKAGGQALWGQKEMHVSLQETVDDESVLLTYSRFHQHYHCTFPGKIRSLGCTAAHVCYVAMGCAEAAVLANESYQGLAAARLIIEAAGGQIYKMSGSEFSLDDYMDGQSLDEHLLVTAAGGYSRVRRYLKEIS